MVIFPRAPDQTIAQMWSNGARGGGAEVLKDFDDSTETAYEDLWKRIEHRFGDVDEGREAQRKFGNTTDGL